ncbi:MAG: M20/M25/M40 family metallo-hydrolase [Verrucomicrobia bacterium]|nr:M20/M25/M40 family metallo-hydrolase [Verrucomicrobiota bacterium]
MKTPFPLPSRLGVIGLALLAFGNCFSAAAAERRTPDFAAARDEVVKNLSGFIQVDTVSPPGNETRGADYLKAILDREGIAAEIFELEKGRGNLVARLKGSGKKKPLLLMGHIDVVGVEREKWTVDPFAAVQKDGFIYGRGAIDDKGMTASLLQVFISLKRLGVPLDRDVIFLACAGEESSTSVGIDFMVAKHWDKIAAEFCINEGGRLFEENGAIKYVGVATGEKVPRPFLLSAKGPSGHASRPSPGNAIVRLSAAVAKAGTWQAPMRLNDTTREYFKRLATISSPEEARLYRSLDDPKTQEELWLHHPAANAALRTTITPTIIKGGFRLNVIPGDALAQLDVRALPDEDIEAFASTLRDVINDPQVEVVPPASFGRPATPPSRMDTELFAALERAQKKMFPKAITIPQMTVGATDSAQLRAKGVQSYGLNVPTSDADGGRMHGNDERVSIKGLGIFLEYLWTVVADVAAAR